MSDPLRTYDLDQLIAEVNRRWGAAIDNAGDHEALSDHPLVTQLRPAQWVDEYHEANDQLRQALGEQKVAAETQRLRDQVHAVAQRAFIAEMERDKWRREAQQAERRAPDERERSLPTPEPDTKSSREAGVEGSVRAHVLQEYGIDLDDTEFDWWGGLRVYLSPRVPPGQILAVSPDGGPVQALVANIDDSPREAAIKFRNAADAGRIRDATDQPRPQRPRPELVPPRALLAVGAVMAAGEEEHGDRWTTRTARHHVGAALRHLLQWLAGESHDRDLATQGKGTHSHLACAAARTLMALDRNLARDAGDRQGD